MTLDQPYGAKRTVSFAKGHGTGNDFIIIEDPFAQTPLSASDVRALCDRRFGVGGDGVLIATRASHMPAPEWDGDPRLWFMDYRNSDGSVAEMCGNGLRVFVRYLVDEGFLPPNRECVVATRAGLRAATAHPDYISVEAGVPRFRGPVRITLGDESWPAVHVDMGNPHAVVLLHTSTAHLQALPVHLKPRWEPVDAYPNDTNVEFVLPTGAREVAMRVHERGSGETLSCGTGIVASAAAFARSRGEEEGTYMVNVPGGRASVELRPGRPAVLTAPARIVFRGTVSLPVPVGVNVK